MKKLSEQLYDAHLLGDQSLIETIQKQLERPKPIVNITKINTLLNDEASSTIDIYDFLNKEFGQDWWEWEIETIFHKLWTDYGLALEDVNRDKVLAIRHLCRNDAAFFDWFEFNQLCNAFGGSIADFELLRSPSPGDVIKCVKTMNHIRPDRNGEFSIDVEKYICIIFYQEGIYCPPPSLAALIALEMRKMVSMSDEWPAIYKRFAEFITGNYKNDIEDNMVSIQAKRLLRTELSASTTPATRAGA